MSLEHEVKNFCRQHNLRLNTNLGQHYLVNQNVLDAILETANIHNNEHIVEIGPGIGILTRELLQQAKHVTAIELDERILPLLQNFTPHKNLTVIHGDALQTPLPNEPYKIVANIPYHITSPLLRHAFFESKTPPTSLTLLIQKEVAQKICDTKNSSVLSIMVRLFGTPSYICSVPPADFIPPPQVDSAVLHIESHPTLPYSKQTIDEVMKLVKLAFSQKRKMLRNTLGAHTEGMQLLQEAGIAPTRRPQTVHLDDWVTLANLRSTTIQNGK